MKDFDKVQDSGQRKEFDTGSRRDINKGKGRFDLIPPYPMRRLAQHYENGADKYGDWNWMLGQNLAQYLSSAERHLTAIKEGLVDEDHASAVVWNIFSFIATKKLIEEGQLPESLNDIVSDVEQARKAQNEYREGKDVVKR